MIYVVDLKNPNVKQVVDNMINDLRRESKKGPLTVTISDKKSKRSVQQNAYAHKLIGLIAEHQGESLESVKRQIKHRIGLIEKRMINGELITEIRSTADLNKDEFSKLIEQVITVCEYLGIDYPTPERYGFEE